MTNTTALEIALLRNKTTKRALAEQLGISLQTLYNKIGNVAEFKASEIIKISEVLKLNSKEREIIFFAKNVDKKSTKV